MIPEGEGVGVPKSQRSRAAGSIVRTHQASPPSRVSPLMASCFCPFSPAEHVGHPALLLSRSPRSLICEWASQPRGPAQCSGLRERPGERSPAAGLFGQTGVHSLDKYSLWILFSISRSGGGGPQSIKRQFHGLHIRNNFRGNPEDECSSSSTFQASFKVLIFIEFVFPFHGLILSHQLAVCRQ